MGASRRARAKNERSFLEHVELVLQSLHSDITDVKDALVFLRGSGIFSYDAPIAPPPAPPPLEVIDKHTLLAFRHAWDIDSGELSGIWEPFDIAFSDLEVPNSSQIDWDSMHFMVDSVLDKSETAVDEYDEISDFVRTQCIEATTDEDEILDSTSATATPECKRSSHKDIAVRIRCAQREAWHRVRRCGNKLSVGTLSLFTSKHDRRVEPGDTVQAVNHDSLEEHFARLQKSISDPGCIAEFSKVLQNIDLGSETSDETKLQQQVPNDDVALPVHVGSCGTAMDSRVRGAVHKPHVPSLNCKSNEDEGMYIDRLEKKLNDMSLDRVDYRLNQDAPCRFLCMVCSSLYDGIEPCRTCGENEVFDISKCHCDGMGACAVCKGISGSDEDIFSPSEMYSETEEDDKV
eukprot:CAMPEP_0169160664 /NCGR_PEP_ID=MMETSP1015-20121227/56588_1 /TAXON_ID=342587 /ORGANISM="Karlodinium micrum, Strain CCMP2283" /LENGTH=403 /DNA_ID=CAMNT_0009232381 /DNA_START=212 /DNA_END=1423 /DNA_ORIENTATION=+